MNDLEALGIICGDVERHIAAGHDLTNVKLSTDIGTLRINLDRVLVAEDLVLLRAIIATTDETLRVLKSVFNVSVDGQAAIDQATAAIQAADATFNATTKEVTS